MKRMADANRAATGHVARQRAAQTLVTKVFEVTHGGPRMPTQFIMEFAVHEIVDAVEGHSTGIASSPTDVMIAWRSFLRHAI